MASRLRVFTKRFFIYANFVFVVIFLLSAFAYSFDPRGWWFISVLCLAFPFLFAVNIFFILGWLIILKPRWALLSGIALLLSLKSFLLFFALHRPDTFQSAKKPGTLRVATWNVARFIEMRKNNNKGSRTRLQMLDQIKKTDADIVCLQEFHTSTLKDYYDNITPIQKDLQYPYYYFSFDTDGDSLYYSSIIFSRYPFIDSGLIRYPRPTLPDVLLYVDVKFGNDTIRVYTTHLQSFQLGKKDYQHIHDIEQVNDSLVENSKSILAKIRRGITNRSIQADIIRDVLDDCPHPKLVCIDMNDVPNSYTYARVKNTMQDLFLKKGFGVGRTFTGLSPTLRIDYIFADKKFFLDQFTRITRKLSDHYMLVADLEMKK
jgi:endonuclease/exonuclease/phosphatase family metal-dependent hydrolase